MKKRFLSILLVLVMLLGALPLTSVIAVAATVVRNDNWYADQTNDGTPNELDIKSPGDFLAFANEIKENSKKHKEIFKNLLHFIFGYDIIAESTGLGGIAQLVRAHA